MHPKHFSLSEPCALSGYSQKFILVTDHKQLFYTPPSAFCHHSEWSGDAFVADVDVDFAVADILLHRFDLSLQRVQFALDSVEFFFDCQHVFDIVGLVSQSA